MQLSSNAFPNNLGEQDHRFLKAGQQLEFKKLSSFKEMSSGIQNIWMDQKGQILA